MYEASSIIIFLQGSFSLLLPLLWHEPWEHTETNTHTPNILAARLWLHLAILQPTTKIQTTPKLPAGCRQSVPVVAWLSVRGSELFVCAKQPWLYVIHLWLCCELISPASCVWLVLKCKRRSDAETLKVECFKSHVTLWVQPVKLSFAAVTSEGDNHEQSGLLTDAACNLHISVGVEPANQSRAPIAAHAYHLHTAAVAPPRERVKGKEKERARMNGVPETEGDLCRVVAHSHLHLSFIQFQRRARLKAHFSGHYNPRLSFTGNEKKSHCCD